MDGELDGFCLFYHPFEHFYPMTIWYIFYTSLLLNKTLLLIVKLSLNNNYYHYYKKKKKKIQWILFNNMSV
jgi:hypothetical protein